MAKKKTVFISDIHMGAGKDWDWFDIKNETPYLISFFQYIQKRQQDDKDLKELVLLGDIFDLWVCPHSEKPQNFEDIVKAQKTVIEEIKKTSDVLPVLYVNGNHDFQVSYEDINKAFAGKVKHIGNIYRRGNILAEHGHRFALFNRPDSKNGGFLRLPLGYYLTRLHTTLGSSRKAKANFILQIIDESFQVMGPEKLPESVLDALKDAVERSKDIKIENFEMGHICANQNYDDVRERYKKLFDDWKESVGFWQSIQMIMSELNRLGTVADQLCRDGVDIVIFGHSHNTKMDKDSWLVKNRIYANCGYWCGFGIKEKIGDNAHFVETDGESVGLFSFKNKKAKSEETLELD